MARVIVVGGAGNLGSAIRRFFESEGNEVLVASRTYSDAKNSVHWNPENPDTLREALDTSDCVINLCGSPINVLWTAENRSQILNSRVGPTRAIGLALQRASTKPRIWINASAIGYYGDTGAKEKSEASPAGVGFLAETCAHWERAAHEHCPQETSLAIVRIGVVFAETSGMLPELVSLSRRFLGGTAGTGKQYVSWIHLQDLCRLMSKIRSENWQGVYNATSPNPVTNNRLMSEVRRFCHRPWSPPVPAFVLKLVSPITRIEPELVLTSQRVVPQAAVAKGFQFAFPWLTDAIKDILPKIS